MLHDVQTEFYVYNFYCVYCEKLRTSKSNLPALTPESGSCATTGE